VVAQSVTLTGPGGQVEHDDLVALEAGHRRPVADGDHAGAVGADVELVDVDGAVAGAGEGQVDPPATIVLPTWTMAATLPSSTCGVQSAGLLDTTAGCGTLTAAPGCAIRPIRTAADKSANRTRRPMSRRFPL
jgi:hypothetical protein